MDELAINRSFSFRKAMFMINRYDTVNDYIRFWLAVGPYWTKYPRSDRVKPWYLGLEDVIAQSLRDH